MKLVPYAEPGRSARGEGGGGRFELPPSAAVVRLTASKYLSSFGKREERRKSNNVVT